MKIKHPQTSIVVLYHNNESYLKACLESIINTVDSEVEILVVVNNRNAEIHKVNIFEDRVRYIHFYEDLGHGKAANLGVENAKHDHVIISDHDLIYHPNWLDNLWELYLNSDNIGAVTCRLLSAQSGRVLDHGIAFSGFSMAHPHMDLPKNHPLVSMNRYPQMISTGGFLISKSTWKNVGGFDESFKSLYTDVDISLQIIKNNLRIAVAKDAMASHFGGRFSPIDRFYKHAALRIDTRGAFLLKNAKCIEADLGSYYQNSIKYFRSVHGNLAKYFICNMMTVVDPEWYENILYSAGGTAYDLIRRPAPERDSQDIGLFELLGYDVMVLGVPIAYFLDRFISAFPNDLWWSRRDGRSDIIIDREANILTVPEARDIYITNY